MNDRDGDEAAGPTARHGSACSYLTSAGKHHEQPKATKITLERQRERHAKRSAVKSTAGASRHTVNPGRPLDERGPPTAPVAVVFNVIHDGGKRRKRHIWVNVGWGREQIECRSIPVGHRWRE